MPLSKEDFDKKVIMYENMVDEEGLNHHNPNFTELMEVQGWEI